MFDLSNLLISVAHAAEPVVPVANAVGMQEDTASVLMRFMPFFLILMVFYFLIIRPQQKRQKEHAALVSSVKTGDKVITNSGIHGIVANVKDRTVIVKVADNVKLEFDRAAITSVDKSSDAAGAVEAK